MLIDKEKSCCFTGHRPNKLPWRTDESSPRCVLLKQKLYDMVEAVYHSGITHFICGMARGCDLFFCEQVLLLRNEYYGKITLEAAIPCEEQTNRWPEAERNRYYRLVAQCDFETLLQTAYTSDCMIKRNRYMVDNASVLIAVFDGTLGGTMQTIHYAMKKKLEIIKIQP